MNISAPHATWRVCSHIRAERFEEVPGLQRQLIRPRVEGRVVGIPSRHGKRIGECFIRIQHFRLEHTLCADRGVGNVILISPCNSRSDGYRDRLWSTNEGVDFHLCGCRRRPVIRGDVR